jgi:hypothetical protein
VYCVVKKQGIWVELEQTQHKAAPLGSFVLGSSFDGAPLGTVNGLAQGSNGTVFVREQAGRVSDQSPQ